MKRYDPERPPNASRWLELDEWERLTLAEEAHRKVASDMPSVQAHASIHVVVENQIAMKIDPVVRALHRLMGEGLSRHDALHAIGSVLSVLLFHRLKGEEQLDGLEPNDWYARELETLTAAKWYQSAGIDDSEG